jgi:hypothetical protein
MRVPYVGQCENHGDVYGRLAGLNLLRGFRQALRERVGGALGCTHITELAQTLPTAVVQAFAGEVIDTRGLGDERPFQIDRCHALRSDGEAVRAHYPRWYRAPSKPAAGPHAGEASAPGPRQPAQDAGTGRPARDPDPGRSARVPHPGPAARDPA